MAERKKKPAPTKKHHDSHESTKMQSVEPVPESETVDIMPPQGNSSSWLANLRLTLEGFFGMRQTQHGMNFGILLISVLGIAILLNVIVSKHVVWQKDMTQRQLFSISEKSIQVLNRLNDKPIKAIAFFSYGTPDEQIQEARDLLDMYKRYYDNLEYEVLDPNTNPILAKEYKLTRDGVIGLSYEGKKELVSSTDEASVTNALVKLTSDKVYNICFVAGRSADLTLDNGYSGLQAYVERDNYTIESIFLLGKDTVPERCDILLLPSGDGDLQDTEVAALRNYFNNNGKALFLLNALDPVNNFAAVLNDFGITVDDSIIVDRQAQYYASPLSPILQEYNSEHVITRNVTPQMQLNTIRRVDIATDTTEGITTDWLLKSGAQSWAESSYDTLMNGEGGSASLDEDAGDVRGPVTVAVAAESNPGTPADSAAAPGAKTRIVVVGDNDFLRDDFIRNPMAYPNTDFFMNVINWLAEEEDLVAISPKDRQVAPIVLTASQGNVIAIIVVIVMPLIIVFFGLGLWLVRKRS